MVSWDIIFESPSKLIVLRRSIIFSNDEGLFIENIDTSTVLGKFLSLLSDKGIVGRVLEVICGILEKYEDVLGLVIVDIGEAVVELDAELIIRVPKVSELVVEPLV